MGNFLKEALKDKNKLLMLVPLLLGVLFVIVFFGHYCPKKLPHRFS